MNKVRHSLNIQTLFGIFPSPLEFNRIRAKVPELFDPTQFKQVITEFGRAIVAKCGFFASRVEYSKVTGTKSQSKATPPYNLVAKICEFDLMWSSVFLDQ